MRTQSAHHTFWITSLAVIGLAVLLGLFVTRTGYFAASGVRATLPLDETYRPQFHFTPVQSWLNDPNGLVYYAGEYHLFYQHNPDDVVWGPMHWGHAVSPDLVNWEHLPIALYPDENGAIFSGSAVVDWRNTAGFGAEALVAVFTHAEGNVQSQSLAYSTDQGRTWTKYAGNPILPPPKNIRNFRDPKVFWYGTVADGHWVMAVAAGNVILFFTSPDLRQWTASGGFGFGYGSSQGVWETPDAFELPIDAGPETRWVLSVGVGDGGPAGGSGTQYFVGSFDGQVFTSENPKPTILWADFGADFYAPQSWSDAPEGRRIWLAWMNNWRYAGTIPTTTWRGAFTLPRALALTTTPEGPRLVQQPIAALERLRDEPQTWLAQTITTPVRAATDTGRYEIVAEFQVDVNLETDRVGLRLYAGENEQATIGYTTKSNILYVERAECPGGEFNPAFAGVHRAPLEPDGGVLRLRVFVDSASIEVFGNEGRVVITDQFFPCAGDPSLEVFADGGPVQLNSLTLYPLDTAQFYLPPVANP